MVARALSAVADRLAYDGFLEHLGIPPDQAFSMGGFKCFPVICVTEQMPQVTAALPAVQRAAFAVQVGNVNQAELSCGCEDYVAKVQGAKVDAQFVQMGHERTQAGQQ